jgi:hypothetical protein
MKPTIEDIERATDQMAVLQFWPSDPQARKGVMMLLSRMVATRSQLAWLVETMVDRVGTWYGPVELRGVYCTRFRPADGIEANCIQTIGFTPIDGESRYLSELEGADDKGLTAGEFTNALKRIM